MPEQTKELAKIADGTKQVNPNDPNAIFSPNGLKQALMVCEHFLASKSLPKSYSNSFQVLMAVQAGRELGMKPVESINGMMIINGQIKLWGTALTGRITKEGYKIKWGDCSKIKASVSVIGPDDKETSPETYTIEEAKEAGLLGKSNWSGHPKTMLRWRALGNAVKFNFPHLLQGMSLVEDDDEVNSVQGEVEVVAQDNATKLLNEKKEEKVEKITADDGVQLIKEIKAVGSKLEEVLKYFKVKKISDLTLCQGDELVKILEKKKGEKKVEEDKKEIKKTEVKKEVKKTPAPIAKPSKSPAAKAMQSGIQKSKDELIKLPADVCKYLNSLEGVDESKLPDDIIYLKIDAGRGNFKGINAYPSLKAELEKFNKEEDKDVFPMTAEIIEISNELAAHDPKDLNEDEKKLIQDCNNNTFAGKISYPKVKF